MVQRSTFQEFLINVDQILITTRGLSLNCVLRRKPMQKANEVILEFWTRLLMKFVL